MDSRLELLTEIKEKAREFSKNKNIEMDLLGAQLEKVATSLDEGMREFDKAIYDLRASQFTEFRFNLNLEIDLFRTLYTGNTYVLVFDDIDYKVEKISDASISVYSRSKYGVLNMIVNVFDRTYTMSVCSLFDQKCHSKPKSLPL